LASHLNKGNTNDFVTIKKYQTPKGLVLLAGETGIEPATDGFGVLEIGFGDFGRYLGISAIIMSCVLRHVNNYDAFGTFL